MCKNYDAYQLDYIFVDNNLQLNREHLNIAKEFPI